MIAISVLIVDDEQLARERLKRMLAVLPNVVCAGEAASGPDAVRMILALRPDVVLIDVSLPGMDGFEIISGVRDSISPLVIVVTAEDQHAVRAFDVGVVDYLLKPVELSRLTESFRRIRQHPFIRLRQHGLQASDEPSDSPHNL